MLEHLIFEKPRRKSSAQSSQSMESNGNTQSGAQLRSRLNSMDDVEQPDSSVKKMRVQVDEPIDERDEIEQEARKQEEAMHRKKSNAF